MASNITVVATDSFWGRMGGKEIKVTKGQVFDASDARVKAFPGFFADIEREAFVRAEVEAATAAPGAKR